MTADLSEVAEIEQRGLSTWTTEMIADELRTENGIQLVARSAGVIVGWACGRRVGKEAELLKIAVTDRCRRRRIGSRLLNRFVGLCAADGAATLFLEVRSRNHAALAFYNGYGFAEIGRRKGYYKKPVDDAVVMQLSVLENGHEGNSR